MKKTTAISLRMSDEEINKIKLAAKLEAYSSYSEFIRRTALLEASRIIKEYKREGNVINERSE